MKRVFDIVLSLCLILLLAPAALGIMLWMAVSNQWPAFYISERMTTGLRPFLLMKFRTMASLATDKIDSGVSGGHKANRITPLGKFLRQTRLDEFPQLWNVLQGDMSFVGPRPPLRHYTEIRRNLYLDVLKNRPGITGLATILVHHHEEFLLSRCTSEQETEMVYVKRCIPKKAALDLLYQNKRSFGLDIYILYLTAAKLVPLPGKRAKRIRAAGG